MTDLSVVYKTDFKKISLWPTTIVSFIIAVIGVAVPMAGGLGCYLLFANDTSDPDNMLRVAFVGVVLTEPLFRSRSKPCASRVGAAVIDDILGIVVLTVLTAFTDTTIQLLALGRIVLFFLFVLVFGLIMHKAFDLMERQWHRHRCLSIYALVFSFLMRFVAERFFDFSDITGAYFAGIVFCSLSDTRDYVASKANVLGHMLFSPLFFVLIGIKTDLEGLTGTLMLFAVGLTVYPEKNYRLRPRHAADGLLGV